MLAKLTLKLRTKEEETLLSTNMASVFHGALMELIDRDYVSELHSNSVHPYSQYIYMEKNNFFWNICTLSVEAYEKIIVPLLNDSFREFELKYHHLTLCVEEKKCTKLSLEEMMKKNYFVDSGRNITISFVTPASFKSDGKYCNYPSVKRIIRSLMSKAENMSEKVNVYDEEILEMMSEKIHISRYNLRSTVFRLEGVKIASFTGWLTLHSDCSQTLTNLLNFLVHIGEYSGCGMKTSIGMGAIKILHSERRGKSGSKTG